MQNLWSLLPLLACPLGMALMGGVMWAMMRTKPGNRMSMVPGRVVDAPDGPSQPADRLAHLHGQLDEVQAQIHALAGENRSVPSPPAKGGGDELHGRSLWPAAHEGRRG